MYPNPDEHSKYNNDANQVNYVDPDYYRKDYRSPLSRSENFSDPYATPVEYNEYTRTRDTNPYQVKEYRGPESLNAYKTETPSEQPSSAQDNEESGGKSKKGLAGIGGFLVAIGAFLLKFKGLLFVLKFGGAGLSALISIAFYALFLGWPFAIGLVTLLFIHEMGHAIVMKIKGIPVGGMIFIPMLGAAVTMQQMPQNARDEAEVGIAGPIAGAISAAGCLFIAQMFPNQPLWSALAYFGFFINLFNLVPVLPFDGGRVLGAIDRRIWFIGFLVLLAYMVWSWINGNFSIWLLFFVGMAALQLWSRGSMRNDPSVSAYYNVPLATRVMLTLLYFGLIAVLVLGMTLSHELMTPFIRS